jgi:hypothetical protein
MALTALDLGLRGAVVGLFLVVCVVLLRSSVVRPAAKLGAALGVAGAAYAISTAPFFPSPFMALAVGSPGETQDKLCFGTARHCLEANGRKVMTFIHNQLAISGDQILHNAPASKALDHRDVDDASRLAHRQIQEALQT